MLMKRFLLLSTLLLVSAMTWAAGIWTPTLTTSSFETPVYVRVTVNGNVINAGIEVAAFIDGECRATATSATMLTDQENPGTTTYAYSLRVLGTASDLAPTQKTIKFKAFYNNLVYEFTAEAQFTGETITPVPLDLYLDAVTGISMPDPITVVSNLPASRDLKQDVTLLYDEANRKNQSVLESEFPYEITMTSGPAIFSITGTTLTATEITGPDGIPVTVKVKGPNYGSNAGPKQYSMSYTTNIVVTEPVIDVTGISLSQDNVTAQIGDNYQTIVEGLVTVLPSTATDPSWTATIDPSSTATVSTARIITGPGTLTVIIASVSNPSVTATLTITVPTPVSFKYPADVVLSKLHNTLVTFTDFEGDGFDKDLISITFAKASNDEPCATATASDASGMKWNFKGEYVGNYTYQVFYDGRPMKTDANGTAGLLHIPAEVQLNNTGWDWISLYAFQAGQATVPLKPDGATSYLAWMNQDANNRIIEVRSQTALLFNDEKWGFIGDITELSPAGGMYKVKAKYADANDCVIGLGADCVPITSTTVSYNTIQKGYTWISYPLETGTTIANTQLTTNAQVGDMIIGKSNTAEYDGTEWVSATPFTFEPGKGYIYYTEGNGGFRPNFNAPAGGGVKRFAPQNAKPSTLNSTSSPWKYDASPFADNMPVVAALEGIEDGSRFSIGAYVGDECRGEGRAVKGNLFMINVAGKSGELVHFRIYDKVTEEFFDLEQSLMYAGHHGSLRAPVCLSGIGVVDGVKTVQRSSQEEEVTYNLAGQQVNKNFRGIVVTKGRKQMKR